MSRLLVVGFVATIAVLGFNYYTAITRNAEASRELIGIKRELREGTSARSDALRKWELCRADVAYARDAGKKLDGELKTKTQMVADLTNQISESRQRENKLKEEIQSVKAQLSAADAKAKV